MTPLTYNKVLVKVSQVVFISVNTYQKAFIFEPQLLWRVGIHIMTPRSLPLGGAGGQNLGHL